MISAPEHVQCIHIYSCGNKTKHFDILEATCISTAPYVSAHLQRSCLHQGFWLVLAHKKKKRQAHGNEETKDVIAPRLPKIRPHVAECSMGSALKKSKQLLKKQFPAPLLFNPVLYLPIYLSTYLAIHPSIPLPTNSSEKNPFQHRIFTSFSPPP